MFFFFFSEKGHKEELCPLPSMSFDKSWRNSIFLKLYPYQIWLKFTTQFKADRESRERTGSLQYKVDF